MCKHIVLLVMFFLSACTVPETRIYTLYLPVETKTISTSSIATVSNTSLIIQMNSEHYLKQPYIAQRSSPYQLEILKYSKWESSPNKIVRNEFKEALSLTGLFKEVRTASVSLSGSYVLKINLKKFEKLNENQSSFGLLVFDIEFYSPDGKELYHDTISKKPLLNTPDITGLAEALSRALKESIQEVKLNIEKVISTSH